MEISDEARAERARRIAVQLSRVEVDARPLRSVLLTKLLRAVIREAEHLSRPGGAPSS